MAEPKEVEHICARSGTRIRESRDSTRTATAAAMAVCFVGLHRLYFEPRAGSSYLMAVVAIMKRCRDRHLQLSSTAFVSSNFCLSIVDSSTLIFFTNYAVSHVSCVVSV